MKKLTTYFPQALSYSCFSLLLCLSVQTLFGQVKENSHIMFLPPFYPKLKNCFTFCLDRSNVPNDSIADVLHRVNSAIKYYPDRWQSCTEKVTKKQGIKKVKTAKSPSKRALQRIKYDTVLLEFVKRPIRRKWSIVNEETVYWKDSNISDFCQVPLGQDCWTVCHFQQPAIMNYRELCKVNVKTLPKNCEVGNRLAENEEWVISPIYEKITTQRLTDYGTHGFFGLNDTPSLTPKEVKSIQDDSSGHYDVYTRWIHFDCFNLNNTAPNLIPYLAFALYQKGYAKRKIVNELDAQFIKDLLKYQEENGLEKGIVNKATLDSLKLDARTEDKFFYQYDWQNYPKLEKKSKK